MGKRIRVLDRRGFFDAFFEGSPTKDGTGSSPASALGALLLAHPEMFGVEIADVTRPTWADDAQATLERVSAVFSGNPTIYPIDLLDMVREERLLNRISAHAGGNLAAWLEHGAEGVHDVEQLLRRVAADLEGDPDGARSIAYVVSNTPGMVWGPAPLRAAVRALPPAMRLRAAGDLIPVAIALGPAASGVSEVRTAVEWASVAQHLSAETRVEVRRRPEGPFAGRLTVTDAAARPGHGVLLVEIKQGPRLP